MTDKDISKTNSKCSICQSEIRGENSNICPVCETLMASGNVQVEILKSPTLWLLAVITVVFIIWSWSK